MRKFTENLTDDLDWINNGDYLEKDFKFNSFSESFEFVKKVAELSEKEKHHPVILISFKRVNLKLRTNKSDSITQIDIKMSNKINKIYNEGI